MIESTKRTTGILTIGEADWGTHFCLFYRTPQDLIEILSPYFKAGLENNEFCMWVTSRPLQVAEAKRALAAVVPDLDDRLARDQIEIIDYREWYTPTGKFNSDSVLQGWVEKEQQALRRGLAGLRLTGNTFWLEEADWKAFTEYEAAVDSVIMQYRMLALCTYSLDRCGASEVIDVVNNHQFALTKRGGHWERIESTGRRMADETRRENIALQSEIAKRQQAERELRRANRALKTISECNQVLVRATDEPTLLEQVCQTLVQVGGYPHVSVDLAEPQGTVRAFSMGQEQSGGKSIALPLTYQEQSLGTFSICSERLDAFDRDEMLLLEELANDLAYGIAAMRLQAERERVEKEIYRLNTELEQRVSQRTAQLEAANQELEAFAYSVSHDLRAPIASIDGFARVVLRDYVAQLPPDGRRFVQLVHDNAVSANRLIDDLLTFSRTSSKPLNKQAVEPFPIVRQVLDELDSARAGRRVDVVIGNLPPCPADPALLKQVYANLIANAIKFTRVREVARIEIGAQVPKASDPSPSSVVYYVQDNGVGFDMEQSERLFGVFQRLHHEDEYEGTGVGLALVERIVRRHGGRVWAEAQEDKGATFCFTLR